MFIRQPTGFLNRENRPKAAHCVFECAPSLRGCSRIWISRALGLGRRCRNKKYETAAHLVFQHVQRFFSSFFRPAGSLCCGFHFSSGRQPLLRLSFSPYGLLFPQFEQKLPVFCVPQVQVHGAFGFLLPQFEQKFPVFTVPQLQVHPPC